MLTLGIETSCDETSAAVLRDGDELLSNVIATQIDVHAKFGGVVPEVAARKHTEAINITIEQALEDAGAALGDIGLIAVTAGPGLAISLVVGISAARALSETLDIPSVGVNHMEGHLLANFISRPRPALPAVCLLVSGGHTDIVLVEGPGEYTFLGGTVDDAAGEAFDKVARLLDLGYPGGPAIQNAAASGDPSKISFPRPMIHEKNFNLSFSGLKTAVVNFMNTGRSKIGTEISPNDIAASFQDAVVDVLVRKTLAAAARHSVSTVMIAGGVAANRPLRDAMKSACDDRDFSFFTPPFEMCTDNAAMIAKTGFELLANGRNGLELTPHPNCSL